ncbi:MAG TPA: hypothetical protein VM367_15150 [Pseudonocardia sp.]|jgi:hypothetical protein|nr:hypothetical protein [Pseudonocardia sp.]
MAARPPDPATALPPSETAVPVARRHRPGTPVPETTWNAVMHLVRVEPDERGTGRFVAARAGVRTAR